MTTKERSQRAGIVAIHMMSHEKNFDMRLVYAPFYTTPLPARAGSIRQAMTCGTTCCIAGHTVVALAEDDMTPVVASQAEKLLGLDGDIAYALFFPLNHVDSRRMAGFPKKHVIENKDVAIGIKALLCAVAMQNKRDEEKANDR